MDSRFSDMSWGVIKPLRASKDAHAEDEVYHNLRVYLLSGEVLGDLSAAGSAELEDVTQRLAMLDSEACIKYRLFLRGLEIPSNVSLKCLGLNASPQWTELQAVRTLQHVFRFARADDETSTANYDHLRAQNYDNLFKVLLVGRAGAGKSSLLSRFTEDMFNDHYIPNNGSDVEFKTTYMVADESKRLKLHVADVRAGGYRNASAALVVFDLTDEESFRSVPFWIESVRTNCGPNVVVCLIGNKVDEIANRKVDLDSALQCAALHRVAYFETSAKKGIRVQDPFHAALGQVLDRTCS